MSTSELLRCMRLNPCLASALAAFLLASTPAVGQLNPPAAPAGTMLPLDQVEPRTPISSLPFTINQPGSYYVTDNLESSTSGLFITADYVTVDLMGHTLTSVGDEDFSGIFLAGSTGNPIVNVSVRNGNVRGFQYGVRINHGRGCEIEGLRVMDSTSIGIYFYNLPGSSEGNTVRDCHIQNSAHYGIHATGNASGGWSRNSIIGCIVEESGGNGLSVSQAGGITRNNLISSCLFRENSGYGIYLSGINGAQMDGYSILETTVSDVASGGILVSSSGEGGDVGDTTIRGCKVVRTDGVGIQISSGSGSVSKGNEILDCQVAVTGNYGIATVGISRSLIQGNHVSSLDETTLQGIRCVGTGGNFIFNNIVSDFGQNYFVNGNDTFGPIVGSSGALANTGDASHPFANFSR